MYNPDTQGPQGTLRVGLNIGHPLTCTQLMEASIRTIGYRDIYRVFPHEYILQMEVCICTEGMVKQLLYPSGIQVLGYQGIPGGISNNPVVSLLISPILDCNFSSTGIVMGIYRYWGNNKYITLGYVEYYILGVQGISMVSQQLQLSGTWQYSRY